ncbi:hypothetical protein INT48_006419, partial [Thamnidium elegans]
KFLKNPHPNKSLCLKNLLFVVIKENNLLLCVQNKKQHLLKRMNHLVLLKQN